jgi:hypothetical protein
MRKVGRRCGATTNRHQERCRARNPFHDDLHLAAASKRCTKAKAERYTEKTGIAKTIMSNLQLNLSEFLS